MVQEAPPQSKIPTKNPQPADAGAKRSSGSPARGGPRSLRAARPGALLHGMPARPPGATVVWWLTWSAG
jgi:hypothetical protein